MDVDKMSLSFISELSLIIMNYILEYNYLGYLLSDLMSYKILRINFLLIHRIPYKL